VRLRTLSAILLLSAPLLQTRAAAPAPISISADKRQLELVPGARATLRISAADTPVLSANVGQIEKLRSLGKGAFEAVYLPPRETYPQVAIIVATSGDAHGWLALPLAGAGEVSVKAGATVTIGDRRFGPQQAGADGRARIRIVVPPGVRYAMSGGKRLKLNTPSVSHVYVTLSRKVVAADESATVLVRAFAVTPEGKPRRRAPLDIGASTGRLSPAREVEPGVFEARWALVSGAAQASVEARLTDETASISRISVSRDAAKHRRMKLSVDRPSVAAGDGTFDFTLAFEDGAGNAFDDLEPRATTNVGAFLGWTRGMPGRWTGHVAIPERLEGDSKVVIVVSAGDLRERREVNLVPGPTAELSVKSKTGSTAQVELAVATVDRFGNPTDDSPPQAKAALGTLDAPVRQGAGIYQVVYHPPASATAARDDVTIRAGHAERLMRVPLRFPGASSLFSFALKGGAAVKSGAVGPAAGVEASVWGLGSDRLGLVMDGAWFNFSQNSTVGSGSSAFALDSKATYLAFTGAPAWRQPLGRRAMLWASLGGGVVHVQSSSRLGSQPSVDEASWVPAGMAAVSLGAKIWGGYPFLEVRALYVGNPRLSGLAGSFVPFFVQGGYRFDAF